MAHALPLLQGAKISDRFVAAGLTTLEAIKSAGTSKLETLVKRQAPFVAAMLQSLEQLPVLRLDVAATDDIFDECCRLEAVLRLCNPQECKIQPGDALHMLVKDAKGKLLFLRKLT